MDTNYYLHIGKRSSNGINNPLLFTWAARPDVRRDAAALHIGDGVTVMDEYGHEMTWAEFKELVREDTRDYRSLGKAFS